MDLRKAQDVNPFNFIAQSLKLVPIAVLLFFSIFFINHFKLSDYFPIRHVKVYGVTQLDQKEVKRLLLPLLQKGFFATNVDVIHDRLQQMPWVSTTLVRRAWPDTIEITVVEKIPVAIWNHKSLLSDKGDIFIPKESFNQFKIPVFVGPIGKQMELLDYFNKINRLLLPLHAKISYLELTPYSSWKMKLDNGITLRLGHKDVLTRIDHFVKVYPKIVGNRAIDVDYIDLRYRNGLAVRWRIDINA